MQVTDVVVAVDSRDGVSRLPEKPRVPLVGGRVEVVAARRCVTNTRGRTTTA